MRPAIQSRKANEFRRVAHQGGESPFVRLGPPLMQRHGHLVATNSEEKPLHLGREIETGITRDQNGIAAKPNRNLCTEIGKEVGQRELMTVKASSGGPGDSG